MKIEPVSIKYTSPLVNKYLWDYPEVSHLFEHNPHELSSFKDRYEVIKRDYDTDRVELVRILTEYNEHLNCGDKTRENLKKLADPDTVAVVTGQQAGVFTGPLYTIYKAITVVQLAGEITAKTGLQVIPLFWVAAEDHDYLEIDHVDYINKGQEPARLKMDYHPPGKYSVGHIPVTEAVYDLIAQLAEDTNPSEYKTGIVNKLRELAEQSGSLADWFAGVMSWLFKKQGLVLVNPLDRGLRRLWSDAFADFLQKNDLVNAKVRAGMAKVRAFGVEPQVEEVENNVNLFLYVNKERLLLLKSGDNYTVRGGSGQWSLDDLTGTAKNNPELLSPNVVLRPIAQDVLLPILAYVAGPGEISYYALYREVYPLFGQRMPVIYPRVNITLIERGAAKYMAKYGVEFTCGASGLNKKLSEYLDSQDRLGIDELFGSFSDGLKNSYLDLIARVAAVDPELAKHGHESLNKLVFQVEHFKKKTHQYHRKSCDLVIKRFRTMENQLFPRHDWQERVFNIFPYLFKYGSGFIETLCETPLLGDHKHKLIYLGD